MAFNPFHVFRKRQKVILASVTILIMFIFVLSSGAGRGDFFDQVASWFGVGKKAQAKTVVTLYGKKVTDQELDELRFQRNLANNFMRVSVSQGLRPGVKELTRSVAALPADQRFRLEDIVQTLDILLNPPTSQQATPQEVQRYQRAIETFQLRFQERLDALKAAANSSPEHADVIRQVAVALFQFVWVQSRQISPYFGNTGETDDLLDFLVWKHQADRLGIQLTDEGVRTEINRQTLSSDTLSGDHSKDAQRVAQVLQEARYGERTPVTVEKVYNALRDELRVGMAQQAILGQQLGMMGKLDENFGVAEVPAYVTPDQFWDYYREQRFTLQKVWLLPIPVAGFLDQVKEQPTEAELRALFKEYRNQEPNPDSDTPGFRRPRRIRIEWVSGRPDSEYYKKLAHERVDATLALSAGVPWLGLGSPAAALDKVWMSVDYISQLVKEYNKEKSRYRQTAWTAPHFQLPYFTALPSPEAAAGAFGSIAAATTQGMPLTAVVSYQAAAVARAGNKFDSALQAEAKDRSRSPFGPAMVLAGSLRSPLETAVTVAALYQQASTTERYLPLSFLADEMRRNIEHQYASKVLEENMDKLRKQVEGWRVKPQDAPAELEKVVKEYDLKHEVMQKPLDQYEIENDPVIKPLKEYLLGANSKSKIGPQLFGDQGGLYTPPPLLPHGNEHLLYWRVEDVPAKSYSSYEEAPPEIKEAVQRAWKLQKAREKAAQVVSQTKEEADQQKNWDLKLRFLRDRAKEKEKENWGPVFDLDHVARLVEQKSALAMPGGGKQYSGYKVPEDKSELINARPDLADRLLKALKQPGDTTVVWDRPMKTYYIALLERAEGEKQLKEDFFAAYRKPARQDPLLMQLMGEQRDRYYRGLMEQLRAEAQGNDKGQWQIDPEFRKRFGRSGRGEED
jgi:hypothetical protein